MDVRDAMIEPGDWRLQITTTQGRVALDGDEAAKLVKWLASQSDYSAWMREALTDGLGPKGDG